MPGKDKNSGYELEAKTDSFWPTSFPRKGTLIIFYGQGVLRHDKKSPDTEKKQVFQFFFYFSLRHDYFSFFHVFIYPFDIGWFWWHNSFTEYFYHIHQIYPPDIGTASNKN